MLRFTAVKLVALVFILLVSGCIPLTAVSPSGEGIEMVMKVRDGGGSVGKVANMARNRLKLLGVARSRVVAGDDATITVRTSALSDKDLVVNTVGKSFMAELRVIDKSIDTSDTSNLDLPPGMELLFRTELDANTGNLKKTPFATETNGALKVGSYIIGAELKKNKDFNRVYILIQLNAEGARLIEKFSADNSEKFAGLIIDDRVYYTAVLWERLTGGRLIVKGFVSEDEAEAFARILLAGPYSSDVELVSVKTY